MQMAQNRWLQKHNEHNEALISSNASSHMMSQKWSEKNIIPRERLGAAKTHKNL